MNELDISGNVEVGAETADSGPSTSTPIQPVISNRFECGLCSYTSADRSNMMRHKAITHANTSNACDTCNKKYKTKYNLSLHISTDHLACTFLCDICSKQFNTRPALVRHKRIHQEKWRFECAYCERKRVRQYRQHIVPS